MPFGGFGGYFGVRLGYFWGTSGMVFAVFGQLSGRSVGCVSEVSGVDALLRLLDWFGSILYILGLLFRRVLTSLDSASRCILVALSVSIAIQI